MDQSIVAVMNSHEAFASNNNNINTTNNLSQNNNFIISGKLIEEMSFWNVISTVLDLISLLLDLKPLS